MRVSAIFAGLLLMCTLANTVGTDETYLIRVQTTSASDMNALADIVDSDDDSATQMIGVIEGTMSRVETISADYQPAMVETPPTMNLIQSATFNPDDSTWSFEYASLAADPTGELPAFKRILYFSKQNVLLSGGDAGNLCLQQSTTLSACIQLSLIHI